MGIELFNRCILPFGCTKGGGGERLNGQAGKDARTNPESVAGTRPSRTLRYTSASSHDGSPARDSMLASLLSRRETTAVMHSDDQRAAMAVLGRPTGRTMLAAPVAKLGGRVLRAGVAGAVEFEDLSLGGARRLADPAALRPPPPPPPPVTNVSAFDSPYGRHYGDLWYGDELGGGSARRLQFGLGQLAPQRWMEQCLSGSINVFTRSWTVFQWQWQQPIGPVQLVVSIGIRMDVIVDVAGALCIDRRELNIAPIPQSRISLTLSAGVSLYIIRGMLGVEAQLMASALVPIMTFGLSTGGGFRVALEMRMVSIPFGIRIFAQVQTLGIQFYPDFKLCLDMFMPVWCEGITWCVPAASLWAAPNATRATR